MTAKDDEQKSIDWQKEKENLNKGGDFFKPEPNSNYDITFLSSPEFYMDEKKYDDEERMYARFEIEVDGEEKVLEIPKLTTENSFYGQIVRYASVNGLVGETIELFRQGDGKQTRYVVTDLADIDEDGEDGNQDVVFEDEG